MNVTNRPNGKDLCKKIFGSKVSIVPYVMPGFGLAQKLMRFIQKILISIV
jgi:rhamnose utilization protein RhaD (predicted bifunctional aldolase and dehydrogenase)